MTTPDRSVVLDGRTIGDHFPGIGRYTVHLAEALAGLAPDRTLLLLYNPGEQNTRFDLERIASRHVNLRLVSCPVSPFALSQQWYIPRVLRNLRPSPAVYHSPYYLMPYRPGLPAIVTIHDLIPLRYPAYFPLRERLFFRLTVWLALRSAGWVITDSAATKADLQEFYPLACDHITVVPAAPAPTFRVQHNLEPVDRLRRRYHLAGRYVLYLGSNKPHKNLGRLVEAWAGVQHRGLDSPCTLVIGGHWDPRYPGARHRAEGMMPAQQIRFIGAVEEDDLPALYAGAEAFVFPSLYEGFGLPVLEAMACGTPVICSNRSSLPEVAGNAAIFIDPVDTEALSNALSRLLTDRSLRDMLRQRGLAHARTFSWERTARETLAVYRRVCPCPSVTNSV